jgi:hypothetical protein
LADFRPCLLETFGSAPCKRQRFTVEPRVTFFKQSGSSQRSAKNFSARAPPPWAGHRGVVPPLPTFLWQPSAPQRSHAKPGGGAEAPAAAAASAGACGKASPAATAAFFRAGDAASISAVAVAVVSAASPPPRARLALGLPSASVFMAAATSAKWFRLMFYLGRAAAFEQLVRGKQLAQEQQN